MTQKPLTPRQWAEGLISLAILVGLGWSAWAVFGPKSSAAPAAPVSVTAPKPEPEPKSQPMPVAAPKTEPPRELLPPTQKEFITEVLASAVDHHLATGNDLRRREIVEQRMAKLTGIARATQWTATDWKAMRLARVVALPGGHAAVAIQLHDGIWIVSSKTGAPPDVIGAGSAMHKVLTSLSTSEPLLVSFTFMRRQVGGREVLQELQAMNGNTNDSIYQPQFVVRFTDVKPAK